MNARYYLPEVGRFISPDTIVPEPGNPQSYNRYAYALNSPTNLTDPTGHCSGSSDGIGNTFDENLCWASVATIGNLWDDTDYWQQQWGSYEDFFANVGSHPMLGTSFFTDELMRYTQSDDYLEWSKALPSTAPKAPVDLGDYTSFSASIIATPIGVTGPHLIIDDFGNVYFGVHFDVAYGVSVSRGDAFIVSNSKPFDNITSLDDLPRTEQEDALQSALSGTAGGLSINQAFFQAALNVSGETKAHIFTEGGIASPAFPVNAQFGKTWLVFDR